MSRSTLRAALIGLSVSALALGAEADAESRPQPGDPLSEIYTWMHANPELSLKEAQSSLLLAEELAALGFEVTTGLGDSFTRQKAETEYGVVRDGVGGYGVVGVLRNGPGPTVMIRTDTDALPVAERTGLPYASEKIDMTWTGVTNGVMHACGHDIHMTSWIGTARQLAAQRAAWSGTLVMIAQPAEELGLGALAMLSDGLFERFPVPDYNLALHVDASLPAGQVAFIPGFAMANVDSVDITLKGVGGHGAYPHLARDPIAAGAALVTALQTLVSRNVDPQRAGVVTVGSFQAGAKHNIIPGQAKLLLTVRSYDEETRTTLLDGIRRIAEGQSATFGLAPPDIFVEPDGTPAVYNDPALAERTRRVAITALGADRVESKDPVMGGEDFARYGRTQEDIPGVLFWLGAVEPDLFARAQNGPLPLPSLHSPFFAPDYGPAIETGTETMTRLALDLLQEG